jgi:hypothetical protein
MILGVLWQKLIKGSCVLGVLQYTDESTLGSGRHGRRRAAVAFHSLLVYPSWPARNRARLPTAASSSLAIYISKPHNRRRFSLFFSLFYRRRSAPPLTVAAIELPPAKTTAPSSSPRSCAPPRPHTPTNSARSACTTISFPFSGEPWPPSRLTWPASSTASSCLLVAPLHLR